MVEANSPNSHAGVHFYRYGCAFKWGIPPNGQLKWKNDDKPLNLEVFLQLFPHSGHLSMEAFRLAPALRGVLRVQLLRAAEEGLQGVVGAAPGDSAWEISMGTIFGGYNGYIVIGGFLWGDYNDY